MPRINYTCNECGARFQLSAYGPYAEVEEEEVCDECGSADVNMGTIEGQQHYEGDERYDDFDNDPGPSGPDYWQNDAGEWRLG